MSYNLGSDAGGTPPTYPSISAKTLRRVRQWTLVAVGLLFLVLVLLWLSGVYTDRLWFGQLGYTRVFATVLALRVGLFLAGTAIAGLFLGANMYLVTRFARGPSTLALPEGSVRLLWAGVVTGMALTVLISSPIFGSMAASQWETFLLMFHRVPFGISDPQFGQDLSFYVVTLPLLEFLQRWVLGLLITAIVVSLVLYFVFFSMRGLNFALTPRMMKHVAGLGVLLMLDIVTLHILDVYSVVLSSSGVVFGGAYTDIQARIPVLWLLAVIAGIAAAGLAASARFVGLRLMVGSFTLWVVMTIVAGLIYPALFQRFQVAPNELAREEPFILRNIQATRAAYGLDAVQERPYSVAGGLTAQDLESNRDTIENIRLWDLQPLQNAYNQIQFMELYYNFLNMDSDRYVIDGRFQQVLLAARELAPENLPAEAQNWVNQKLLYTHGYGVAMSPATGFTPGEGRPQFLIQDIPIRGEIPISLPQIYYGESPANFAIVNTSLNEIDPSPEFQHYSGTGGVPLSSPLRRLAYARQFGDINILLSDQITRESRVQYRRQVSQRVMSIAPFLLLDRDPYPVVDGEGKIWWIQDAYTTTSRYPYSTPFEGQFNYIRNSVKVVVDAYNGDVQFYVMDSEDPLLRMYQKAFPELFQGLEEMPEDLRGHVRYPVGLFAAQAEIYLRYHVTDPRVFFNQSDQWALPLETRFGKQGVKMTPSYLVMQLPGEERQEFVLMVPFAPAGDKKNLVGWLTARNDWPHYGELIGYRLPDDRQIDGPSQVEARIENDQQVSQQFTLWDGAGSEIIRGQLLVIPIADAIIYVEPLYLQSQGLPFPELKKVILANANRLVMADTIDEGLAQLVGGGPTPPVAGGPASPPAGPGGAEELERLEQAVEELQQALDGMREALEDLRNIMGGG